MLLQDARADPASGHDLSAGAGSGGGPSAGVADGQQLLPTTGKGLTSHPGSHGAAAAEVDKGRAQHSMSQAAAKVQLFIPAPKGLAYTAVCWQHRLCRCMPYCKLPADNQAVSDLAASRPSLLYRLLPSQYLLAHATFLSWVPNILLLCTTSQPCYPSTGLAPALTATSWYCCLPGTAQHVYTLFAAPNSVSCGSAILFAPASKQCRTASRLINRHMNRHNSNITNKDSSNKTIYGVSRSETHVTARLDQTCFCRRKEFYQEIKKEREVSLLEAAGFSLRFAHSLKKNDEGLAISLAFCPGFRRAILSALCRMTYWPQNIAPSCMPNALMHAKTGSTYAGN